MAKWQIALLAVVFAGAVAATVAGNPNSYAYAFATGQCFAKPVPDICHRHGKGGWR